MQSDSGLSYDDSPQEKPKISLFSSLLTGIGRRTVRFGLYPPPYVARFPIKKEKTLDSPVSMRVCRPLPSFPHFRRFHSDSTADAIFLTTGDFSYHGVLREAFRVRGSIP